jgi:signal transduction histidine kinase
LHWYRSLYWRIALGFVVFLAAMLVVQAMLYTWVVARSGRTLPGQSPNGFAQTVANDLANTLERDPKVDLDRYVHDQYAQVAHPFFVMRADGTVINFGTGPISEPLLRLAHARLRRRSERVERPGGERPDLDWPDRSGGPGFRFNRPVPIIVNGQTAGVVVVPPRAPFGFLLRRFAPTLSLVAGGVLIVGTILASVLIFGPARRRLRGLESAARSFGAGDLSARAPDRGGDEIASVASAFNVMADDLAARAEALTASDRVRRQLLADVSHELTTPVTALRGYLETLTMPDLALDEATRARYLTIISDETARLERIIGDLLDLARLEGGGGSLFIERVSIAQLFDRVAARHERACQTAGVTLRTSIDSGAEHVRGDRDRLEQALQNLAANAIRYAPPGSMLRLSARVAGGVGSRFQFLRTGAAETETGVAQTENDSRHQVVIAVEDEGPGIPEEHLAHVFDRFYKAEASRGGASGSSGLGLSIVKAIVERHGGRIAVSSVPGRTVFEIVLPNNDIAGLQDYRMAGGEGTK